MVVLGNTRDDAHRLRRTFDDHHERDLYADVQAQQLPQLDSVSIALQRNKIGMKTHQCYFFVRRCLLFPVFTIA